MTEKVMVRKGTYQDSAFLMRVARELKGLAGVEEAVVLMGTPMNRALLSDAGFTGREIAEATPMDMVVALRAASADILGKAERELEGLLQGRQKAKSGGAAVPRDLATALAELPEANLVSISVPGAYAAYVARRAIEAGRHVFLFSNNVELEDELALKRAALERGLLVMGPDCGTAIIAGVGLGFANRVRRGAVGLVGASGTGLQEVSCAVDALGEGVSHAIGTGSRDLSKEVGGAMSELGLRLLAADPSTKVIALIAKHPADEVAARMHDVLKALGKPVVVRYLGKPARPSADGVHYAATLDEAAQVAVSLARSERASASELEEETAGSASALVGEHGLPRGRLVGLFGGGSLASEAKLILARRDIAATEPDRPLAERGPVEGEGNLIVDTGEDFYTVGKPHPMVDQAVRCALLRKVVADPAVGVVLLDLVLGDGSHPNPAPELAQALADGLKARGGKARPAVIASVTGTDADPQGATRQRALLAAAGIHVEPTAARAAHVAAALASAAQRSKR